MNLNLIRPKNQTKDLFLSEIKICEAPFEQTHRKTEETLEFKLTKPRKKFHSNSAIQIKEG